MLSMTYEENEDFDMSMKAIDIVFQNIKKNYGNKSIDAAQSCCDKK